MAQHTKHTHHTVELQKACCSSHSREASDQQALEPMPVCRYSHPIFPAGGSSSTDSHAAIMAALEQQTNLLAELLAAVTGLTAACLCQSNPHRKEKCGD